MRNDAGKVVYVEPPEGTVVDLTPLAFELYLIANAIRHCGLPAPDYSMAVQEAYWEALYAGDGPDWDEFQPTPSAIAEVFETAAELADYLGV